MEFADLTVAGSDWTDGQNDVLVRDYFAMLNEEKAGRPYVKARHREAVSHLIGRSDGSVERKYMNVSAVLTKLGLPRIRGYAPNEHAQFKGLVAAIERYLAANQAALEPDVPIPILADDYNPFVDPPTLRDADVQAAALFFVCDAPHSGISNRGSPRDDDFFEQILECVSIQKLRPSMVRPLLQIASIEISDCDFA